MSYQLVLKDYEKYPFLESFSQHAAKLPQMQLPLYRLMETPEGKKSLKLARLRILLAIEHTSPDDLIYDKDVKIKISSLLPSLLSYGISRMIVSCTTQFMINKYATSEMEKSIRYLSSELPHIRDEVEKNLGLIKILNEFILKIIFPSA